MTKPENQPFIFFLWNRFKIIKTGDCAKKQREKITGDNVDKARESVPQAKARGDEAET